VSAARAGNSVTVATNWNAPRGYRLLHMSLPSNTPVPLVSRPVAVQARAGAVAVGGVQNVTTDAQGRVTIDYGAAAATITSVEIADEHGNGGTASL
jgi:hypothetical protein